MSTQSDSSTKPAVGWGRLGDIEKDVGLRAPASVITDLVAELIGPGESLHRPVMNVIAVDSKVLGAARPGHDGECVLV